MTIVEVRNRLRSSNTRFTATMLTAQVGVAGGALLINVIAARFLGPSARGELALYLQICYSANLISMLGRNRSYLATSATVDKLSVALREVSALSRVPLMIAAGIAVSAGAVLGGTGPAILIGALWLTIASGVLVHMHRAAAIVSRRAEPYLWSTVTAQALMVSCAFLLIFAGWDSVSAWLGLYGLTALVPYLTFEILLRRRDRSPGRGPAELEPTRRLGARLLPAGAADALLTRSDRFLLPVLSSFQQLGVYVVVATVTELINWPLKQYIDGKTPEWTRQAAHGLLQPWQVLRSTATYALCVSASVGALTWVLLVPVFGDAYREGRQLVLPLAAASGCYALSLVGVAVATASHHPRLAGWVASSGMVVAMPLYVLLIGPYGALGAALGSLAGYAVSAVLGIVAVATVAGATQGVEA